MFVGAVPLYFKAYDDNLYLLVTHKHHMLTCAHTYMHASMHVFYIHFTVCNIIYIPTQHVHADK